MTQRDRDRLLVLKKAQKKLIKQREAAAELGLTERHVRRMLVKLREVGDRAVIHGLRGRPSNRRVGEKLREKAVRILSQEVYRGFGPTLASEYLAQKHGVGVGRETLRQVMIAAGLWRRRRQKVEQVHEWRPRRSSRGELVQWDTSEHDWLEGRGEKLYLIHMIDDATSELTGKFVRQDSTEENMRLLWAYLQRHGRPVSMYTDKASLFQTAVKTRRDLQGQGRDSSPMPPTQIGRALWELGIGWIGAHSPQAKGRVERSFGVAQDRLVKGLRVAGAQTLEQANRYLEEEFLPWWNQHLRVMPANPTDAHRPLGREHDLASALSRVESRQVANDYTIQLDRQRYQIARPHVRPGLRGANVRVEVRLEGSLAVRFQQWYLPVKPCQPQPKPSAKPLVRPPRKARPPRRTAWLKPLNLSRSLPVWIAAHIDRTRVTDSLE
jgi:hypothetical protein